MTLFGRTLDGQDIAFLVFMLMSLVLWAGAWRTEHNWGRFFKQWNSERKARRDAELAAERGDTPTDTDRGPRGPWG